MSDLHAQDVIRDALIKAGFRCGEWHENAGGINYVDQERYEKSAGGMTLSTTRGGSFPSDFYLVTLERSGGYSSR